MRPFILSALLVVGACVQPSRETVQLAAELRRAPEGAQAMAMADRPVDCAIRDRACVTLWMVRGAACARLAETSQEARRRNCAVEAFGRAAELTPADAPATERAEPAIRLAEALERRRDRAMGEARRADNAAILAAVAPLGGPTAGYAAHYAAGVGINRVVAGDVPAAGRCAALAEAAATLAGAAGAPGLPPIEDRIAQRRASLQAARAAQQPECR